MEATEASVLNPSSSVEHLHVLGNSLYCSGKMSEAIETPDSAILMVEAERKPWGEPLLKGGDNSLIQKQLYCGFHSNYANQQHAPDSFFEGECDVGPRPIHSSLHIDYSSMPTLDTSIIEAVLLYNKGIVHHSDGDHESAADTYGLALAALTRLWSPSIIGSEAVVSCLSRIRTLIHNNLGQIRYLNGDDNNALFHFDTALQLSKQVVHFGDEQEWTLTVATFASNLARTQWMIGDLHSEGQINIFQEVLRLRSLWLPADHPDVLCAHLNLGFFLYFRDDKQTAKLHIQEYLKHASKDGSNLDPIPAMAYILLIENEDKDDHVSLELVRTLQYLLEMREDFGEVNVEVASLLNYVGTLLFHRRQLEEAMLFYKHELELENKMTENAGGICISVTYNNIGRILQELGKFNEAIGCYQQALKTDSTGNFCNPSLVKRMLSDQSPCFTASMPESTLNLYSTIWYNLGLIYDRMGFRRKAIFAFRMSLKLRQTLFGNDHQDVACLWYNIGTLQMERQQLDDASKSLQEALRIKRMGCFVEDPEKIAATLSKLAYLQEGRGRLEEALTTHGEILQLHSLSSPVNSKASTAATLFQMSELRYAQGNTEIALELARQSLAALLLSDDIVTSQQFQNHIKAVETVAKTMLLIGSLEHELLNVDSACETFSRARCFVQHAIHPYGGAAAPQLCSLLGSLALISRPTCAPQA